MHRHFILFKPYGYLSQFIYELKRKKKLLGELFDLRWLFARQREDVNHAQALRGKFFLQGFHAAIVCSVSFSYKICWEPSATASD